MCEIKCNLIILRTLIQQALLISISKWENARGRFSMREPPPPTRIGMWNSSRKKKKRVSRATLRTIVFRARVSREYGDTRARCFSPRVSRHAPRCKYGAQAVDGVLRSLRSSDTTTRLIRRNATRRDATRCEAMRSSNRGWRRERKSGFTMCDVMLFSLNSRLNFEACTARSKLSDSLINPTTVLRIFPFYFSHFSLDLCIF